MKDTTGPAIDPGEAVIRLPMRGRRVCWTKALTGLFLDTLAATGNIAGSARRIGIDPAQAYYRLRTNEGFAEGWAAAIRAGYQTVEVRMIGHVLSEGETEGDGTSGFNWEQALRLMAVRDSQQKTGGSGARRGGAPRQVATREETDAAILQRLKRLAAKANRAGGGE